MSALLKKLIPALKKLKLRHPADDQVSHSHTVAYIVEEADGYWLEIACQRDSCQGKLRRKLLPDQVRAWGL